MQHRRQLTRALVAPLLLTPVFACGACVLVASTSDPGVDASTTDNGSPDASATDGSSLGVSPTDNSSPDASATDGSSLGVSPTGASTAASTTDGPRHGASATDADSMAVSSPSPSASEGTPTAGSSSGDSLTLATRSSASEGYASVDGGADSALECVKLTSPAPDLSEFTLVSATSERSEWSFVSPEGFTGILYVASSGLVSEMQSQPNAALHITGTVGDYAQFGLQFYPCVDASSFDGISLDLAGVVGTDNRMRAEVQLRSTTIRGRVPAAACVPSNPELWWYECAPPDQMVTVPTPAAVVELPWSTFTSGIPTYFPDPTEITGIELEFPWSDGAPSYQTDLVVRSISFFAE